MMRALGPRAGILALGLLVVVHLGSCAMSSSTECRTPPVAALPPTTAEWGPEDDEFFASRRFCKPRHLFDFSSIRSRRELNAVKLAMSDILTVGSLRSEGPPFGKFNYPPPVSPEGWRQMNDPRNAVPVAPGKYGQIERPVRYYPSRYKNFRVNGLSWICVDIEFDIFRREGPLFMQTHRFERDGQGKWLFVGFGGEGCA